MLQSILLTPVEHILQQRALLLFDGNDDFATELKRYFVLSAEIDQQVIAANAVYCFETSRFIIDPGMDYPAVVAGLMFSQPVFFFEQEYFESWAHSLNLERCCQTDNPSTNNNYIVLHFIYFLYFQPRGFYTSPNFSTPAL